MGEILLGSEFERGMVLSLEFGMGKEALEVLRPWARADRAKLSGVVRTSRLGSPATRFSGDESGWREREAWHLNPRSRAPGSRGASVAIRFNRMFHHMRMQYSHMRILVLRLYQQGCGAAVLMGEVQFLGIQRLAQHPKRRGETQAASAPVSK